jgi:hypothetical protein
MQKFSNWIVKYSTGWLTIFAVTFFVLFSVLSLPGQNAIAQKYSNGMGSPDTSMFYNGVSLYSLASTYGEEGRSAYLHARWTFDLAFPFVYAIFLTTTISWVIRRIASVGSIWRELNLLPILALILDLGENSTASLVMAAFPKHNLLGETLAPFFTPLKWVAVCGSFLILAVILIIFLFKRIIGLRK